MLNKICIFIALLGLTVFAIADEVQVSPDSPEKYVVQKGDTLWDIAGRFLTQPWRWPEIWKVNPQIADPNLIYPGDVVSLSYEGGSPVLTVDRESGSGAGMASRDGGGGRTVKLTPEVRTEERADAIPSIPVDAIKQFLSRPLVVGDTEMSGWPYVVSSFDERLITGAGNRIYVRGIKPSDPKRYSIYRRGPAYVSSSKVLGYEAIYVGDATVEQFGEPSTLLVTRSTREVVNGDRLLPQSREDVNSDFIPRSPGSDVSGHIISVIDGLSEIGQYQIVVLDVGANRGLEQGHVLGVYQGGKKVADKVAAGSQSESGLMDWLGRYKSRGESVQLPERYTGVLMVIRTFPEVSYALVMEATGPLKLQDSVRNL